MRTPVSRLSPFLEQTMIASRRTQALIGVLAASLLLFACRDLTRPNGLRSPAGSSRLLNPTGTVAVTPSDMHSWMFYDDQHDVACSDVTVCQLVQGPAGVLAGSGSAELATPAAGDGKALVLPGYAGTRLDQITDLRYSTYRQTADAGNNLAISLQFNVDYDLTDAATGYQGRIVFEPYQGIGGNVPQNTWQTWDAKTGKWWGTKTSVSKNGGVVFRIRACRQALAHGRGCCRPSPTSGYTQLSLRSC